METKSEKYYDASELTPAYPVHPGGLIGEEIKERGISQKEFAQKIGMQASQLSAIIHGVRNITPAVAAKLELGFGNISAEFWTRMQDKYNIDKQKKRLNTARIVSGYTPGAQGSLAALAEPGAIYGDRIRISVKLPAKDQKLLELLAFRLGWEVAEDTNPES